MGVFAYPPETVYSFRGDMQKPPMIIHHPTVIGAFRSLEHHLQVR